MESTTEIIERMGGIDGILKGNPKIRTFPWEDGWYLRSCRRESQFSALWQQYAMPESDAPDELYCEELEVMHRDRDEDFDSLVARWARIYGADERDDFSGLKHDEFCDTAYWLGLAHWLKLGASFTCADCAGIFHAGRGLEVHHKTYRNRGQEYPDHLEDLVVLCRGCHGRRHGK